MSTLSVIYKIGADITALQQGVDRAAAATESMANTANLAKNAVMAMAGSAVVGKVTELVGAIYDNADALVKMSDQTTIGVEALQKLRGVGDETGNTIEELTSAITMMQKRLGSGDESALKSLDKLNISFEEFKSLDAYSMFVQVSNAVKQIHDPLEFAQVQSGLFGRQWATITPTVKANLEEIAAKINVVSEDIIKRQDEIGDAFARLKRNGSADMAQLFDYLFSGWKRADDAAKNYQDRLDKMLNMSPTKNMPSPLAVPGMPVKDMRGLEDFLTEGAKDQIAFTEATIRSFNSLQKFLQLVAEGAAPNGVRALASDFQTLVATTIDVEEAVNHSDGPWGEYLDNVVYLSQELDTSLVPSMVSLAGALNQTEDAAKKSSKGVASFSSSLHEMFSGDIMSGLHNFGTALKNAFDPSIFLSTLLSGALSGLVSQALSSLGKVVWEGLKKIGGFFKQLFGGPSAEELAGRDMVAAFEDNLHSMLTDAQKTGVGWKDTIIAVRDAYIQAGLTEAQALEDVARLWDSSRQGPEAVAAAIQTIQDRMHGLTQATNQAGDALSGLGGRISIPDLPREMIDVPAMASGGIVTRPTFALIGEGGPEAVLPLSRMGGSAPMQSGPVYLVLRDGRIVGELATKTQDRDLRLRYKMAAA